MKKIIPVDSRTSVGKKFAILPGPTDLSRSSTNPPRTDGFIEELHQNYVNFSADAAMPASLKRQLTTLVQKMSFDEINRTYSEWSSEKLLSDLVGLGHQYR